MHLPEKLSLPCQPRVVALLMNELRSTNPSLRRLNQLFGSDPVLAAWLLEQANAGIYQLSGMVQTIPQAVALLLHGMNTCCSITGSCFILIRSQKRKRN